MPSCFLLEGSGGDGDGDGDRFPLELRSDSYPRRGRLLLGLKLLGANDGAFTVLVLDDGGNDFVVRNFGVPV